MEPNVHLIVHGRSLDRLAGSSDRGIGLEKRQEHIHCFVMSGDEGKVAVQVARHENLESRGYIFQETSDWPGHEMSVCFGLDLVSQSRQLMLHFILGPTQPVRVPLDVLDPLGREPSFDLVRRHGRSLADGHRHAIT